MEPEVPCTFFPSPYTAVYFLSDTHFYREYLMYRCVLMGRICNGKSLNMTELSFNTFSVEVALL